MRNLDQIEFDVDLVTLTPEIARQWLREYEYKKQRPMTPFQKRALKRAIATRTYVPVSISLAKIGRDATYLVDGQHRLTMIGEGDLAVKHPVTVYKCLDALEVWDVYIRLDQGRRRSGDQILCKDPIFEPYEFEPSEVRALDGGMKWLSCGFRNSGTGRPDAGMKFVADRLSHIEPWIEAARDFFRASAAENHDLSGRLRKGSLAGFGVLTCREQREAATEFWKQIATADERESRASEAAREAYYVISRANGGPNSDAKTVHRVAACWNAFYGGIALAVPEDPNHLDPLLVLGTLFDGSDKCPYHFDP